MYEEYRQVSEGKISDKMESKLMQPRLALGEAKVIPVAKEGLIYARMKGAIAHREKEKGKWKGIEEITDMGM